MLYSNENTLKIDFEKDLLVWGQGVDSKYIHKAQHWGDWKNCLSMSLAVALVFSFGTHLSHPVFQATQMHQQFGMIAAEKRIQLLG